MLVEVWGEGPPVVLVHGAITNGPATWSKQRPLADRWALHVLTRPGFAPSPPTEERSDFEVHAAVVAEHLDTVGPAHLVGHSYGGLIALLTAAARPERVRTLTVIEPAVMSLVRGDAEVEESIAGFEPMLAEHGHDPRAMLAFLTSELGGDPEALPDPLPPPLLQNVEVFMTERPPWEATIPVDALASAPFPTLVVSGGYSAFHEKMCDALAVALGERATRVVIEGGAHNVQRTGEPFNARLEKHLLLAEASPSVL